MGVRGSFSGSEFGFAQILMDLLEQKCRITRGCKHCGMDDGASCIVVNSGL